MKYLVVLITLFASTAHASSAENCIDMARDYLMSVDQAQAAMIVDSKREKFVALCKANDDFNQAFKQRGVVGEPAYAIHNNKAADHGNRSFYRI